MDKRAVIPNTREGQNAPGALFRQVRAIMQEPIRPPDPLNDAEIEALMWQPPITDFPNDGMQLPANEEPDPNQLQLI